MWRSIRIAGMATALSGLAVGSGALGKAAYAEVLQSVNEERDAPLVNWSSTHEVTVKRLFQPESAAQLQATMSACSRDGQHMRPLGSGLSPNGIAFDEKGTLSLGLLDKVLEVDKDKKTVRVQAGATVSQLVEHLRPYNLTLQNYASIAEQQIGGFLQVGAHGTGSRIPPVDEQVQSMRLLTPGLGLLELGIDQNPTLFRLARVALGALGIVTDVDIKCVDAHLLREYTFPATVAQVREHHDEWLRSHQHIRYMWIPLTDTVVVVWSDPVEGETVRQDAKFSEEEALGAPRDLLSALRPDLDPQYVNELTFSQLRDELIHMDPLNTQHIKNVNAAEAEYWSKKEGIRIDWSDKILGFDCGGQQWVSEVAFPCGSQSKPSTADLDYLEETMKFIVENDVPAPAPIEQRWTAPSTSNMSPVWSADPEAIFSWVGIIMYLPPAGASPETDKTREFITKAFQKYQQALEKSLWDKYGAMEHWAKIEPTSPLVQGKRERLQRRVPLERFREARAVLDPQGILSSEGLDILLAT